MAFDLPPFKWPLDQRQWEDVYRKITDAAAFIWNQIDTSGANLTDLPTRNHADLQNINTSSYTHLTAANHTDLTDGGTSALHYHTADRARANHTGVQAISTVTGLQTALDTNTGDVTIGTANGLSIVGQAISLQVATDSVPGALTAADHATFAAKEPAISAGTTLQYWRGDKSWQAIQSIILFTHYADAGNITTGETDLYSDTIAAGQLASNGESLQAEYGGIFVSSATATRQLKVYFGGTQVFDSGALSISAGADAWNIRVMVVRADATTSRVSVTMNLTGAAMTAFCSYTAVTATLANTQVLKITGQAAGVGASTDDILAKLSKSEWRS